MAWRLRSSVVRGEIDNRVKGKISGKVWLAGRDEPVLLKLEGNGYCDVAGCLFTFVNPIPQVGDEHTDLFPEQVGAIGDYTASRKVRAFDIPVDEALAMIRRGEKPPEHMANCLYLEWFSDRNGRVVIESYDYEMNIVDTSWTLTEQDEAEQREKNADSMVGFMQRLGEAIEAPQKSDLFDFDDIDSEKPTPNPQTEGIDWIRDEDEEVVHPLQHRAFEIQMTLWHECHDSGLLEPGAGNGELRDMVDNAADFSAELAGALNDMAYEPTPKDGFDLVSLRRAWQSFNEMAKALGKVREKKLLPEERLSRFSNDMFAIRAEIVQLMERF